MGGCRQRPASLATRVQPPVQAGQSVGYGSRGCAAFDWSRRLHPSCEARDIVARQMPPAQIAEAQRLAREWDAAHPREP